MEITNEIKVLNQFIGFKVQFIGHGSVIRNKEYGYLVESPFSGTEFGIINEEFLPNNQVKCYSFYKDIRVILKPISSITDEDAIEVAEIINQSKYHVMEDPYFDPTRKCISVATSDKDGDNYGGVVRIFPNGIIEWDYHNSDEYDYTEMLIFHAYQFLQSKGYDLPQYLLGDKTLKEAGLAIYEEDLK